MEAKAHRICAICFIGIALLFSGVATNASENEVKRRIFIAEIQKVLQTENMDLIVRSMNDIKQQNSPELLGFILDLWKEDEKKHTDLPWHIIRSSRVKTELANILAQGANNGLISVNREELKLYSRKMAITKNGGVRRTAILTLGLLGDPDDVTLLKEIALKEEAATFRAAVIAIAKICDRTAENALIEIRARVADRENKSFAESPISELAPHKRCAK